MEAPPWNLQDLKGCVANVLVPDTTAHLQRSREKEEGCFSGKNQVDLHNISQVFIMLWLISESSSFMAIMDCVLAI